MVDLFLFKTIVVVCLTAVGFLLSFLVLLSNKKSKANQWLFLMINLSIISILFDYFSNMFQGVMPFILIRLAYGLNILATACLYSFTRFFPYKNEAKKIINISFITASAIIFFLTVFTDLIVKNVEMVSWGNQVTPGILIFLHYIFMMIAIIYSLVRVTRSCHGSSKVETLKIRFMTGGVTIYVGFQAVFNIILPQFGIDNLYFLGDYSIVIFFCLVSYAIVKHHLFDVRLTVVRSITYSLVITALALIYFGLTFLVSMIFDRKMASFEQTATGVVTSLIMAFAFQPLKRFFDKITNKIFYKDNYHRDEFFARLNRTLSSTTDLRGLLERTSNEIAITLKCQQVFFFVYTGEDHYVTAGTEQHSPLLKADADDLENIFEGPNMHSIIVASTLDHESDLRRMMISSHLEVIVQLIQPDGVVGYLCLGDHQTSGYTSRDMSVLNTIADELTIAIQNALSIQEVKDLNSGLQQRVDEATKELRASNAQLQKLDKMKDEFVSITSHQLRTPLTSVKGYISMVLDGDAGEVNESQRKLLNEAFNSSERMVHLIGDFLNVSRLQTGKFMIEKVPTDLSLLVEQEIDGLKPSALSRNMKLECKISKKIPILDLDESKFRQVIMNFADNAIYYSHENSDINISLSVEGEEVVYTVKDTGIGVPDAERAQLFTKFYRATNAKKQRPDGTGVGLYLAKKIVDSHGGSIIFESVEGKGSTFGFRLPIK